MGWGHPPTMEATGTGIGWNHDEGTLSLRAIHSEDDAEDVVLGEVTLTPDQWMDAIPSVIGTLLGKPNTAGDGYAVGPLGADAGVIGDLIANGVRRAQGDLSTGP